MEKVICAGLWECIIIATETFTDHVVPEFIVYKHLMHSNGYLAAQQYRVDSLDQGSVNRQNHAKTLLPFDLQSALNTCKMLFPRPMRLRPDMSHSLPYMPNVDDLQTLLHLFRQIPDVFPIVVG